jgi:tRNA(Ile)-lysidine synthase TilS/MesJ
MNRVALEHGYPVVATGHNLDDEAATLFGSVLHWQMDALPRQSPMLESTHPWVRTYFQGKRGGMLVDRRMSASP